MESVPQDTTAGSERLGLETGGNWKKRGRICLCDPWKQGLIGVRPEWCHLSVETRFRGDEDGIPNMVICGARTFGRTMKKLSGPKQVSLLTSYLNSITTHPSSSCAVSPSISSPFFSIIIISISYSNFHHDARTETRSVPNTPSSS